MNKIKLRIAGYGQFGRWVRFVAVAVNRLPPLVLVMTINAVAYAQPLTDLGQLTERGQWAQTSKGPLSPRRNSSVALVGNEIFVFGGDVSISPCALPGSTASCSPSTIPLLKDGAAYDVNSDSWRHITCQFPGLLRAVAIQRLASFWYSCQAIQVDSAQARTFIAYSSGVAASWMQIIVTDPRCPGGGLSGRSNSPGPFSQR